MQNTYYVFFILKKRVNKCPFTQNVIHTVALFLWNQGLCFTKELAAYDQIHQCSFFKLQFKIITLIPITHSKIFELVWNNLFCIN